jgi:hypothetical protein
VKLVLALLTALYAAVAAFFAITGLLLIGLAGRMLWAAVRELDGDPVTAARHVIEGMGLLAIALVAVEIAQTVTEEEVVREAHISAPTRVRRYLSRFLVVVVVALSIETLVATFSFLHENPSGLPYAASVGAAAAALLVAWGAFIKLNRSAEELEPEEMERAKREDRKLG